MNEEAWFRVLGKDEQKFLIQHPQYRGCMLCWVWRHNFSREFRDLPDSTGIQYQAFLEKVDAFTCEHPTYVAGDHFTLDQIDQLHAEHK